MGSMRSIDLKTEDHSSRKQLKIWTRELPMMLASYSSCGRDKGFVSQVSMYSKPNFSKQEVVGKRTCDF